MSAVARRPRKQPVVGARIAGFQHDDAWGGPIYQPGSVFGELGDAFWYRMRASSGRTDAWRISTSVCGCKVLLNATVDDFGNLVALQEFAS
jgi:hypothetical protein